MTPSNRLIHIDDTQADPNRALEDSDRIAAARFMARPRQTPQPGLAGPYVGRRQVTAHIDAHLFKWLKVIHAQTGIPMVRIFETALQEYRDRYAAQRRFGGAGDAKGIDI